MRIKFLAIVVVLIAAIFCFVAPAATQAAACPTGDVACQINFLLQQIADLQAQLAQLQTQQGATPTWCHTFNTNLGYANSGSAEVGYLHTALDKQGISYAPDTGNKYSEPTMGAVVQFQAKYGILPTTGYTGARTRAKLNSLYRCPTNTPTTPPTTTSAPVSIPTPTLTPNLTSVTCTELIPGYNDSSANKINLIFVGYGYENSPGSIHDVSYDIIMNQQGIFSIEPYKTNKNKFNLWYINQSGSLSNDCTLTNGIYNCNDSLLIRDCPTGNNYKVHLVNSIYGRSGGGNPIVIQSADSMCNSLCRARIFIHEFSHSFANLLDEYSGDPGEFPSTLTDPTKNCYAGPNHAQQECLLQAPWKNLIGNGCGRDGVIDCTENDPNYNKEIGCYEGCNHFDLGIFKPTRGSYMLDGVRYPYFGLWNEKLIQDKFSNVVSPPSPPSNLIAKNAVVSFSQIDLVWADNSDNEIGFKIERSTSLTGPFVQVSTMNSNVTSWTDAGLMSATTYYYRVSAYNSGGDSTYSNIAFVTTTLPPPSISITSPNGGEFWKVGETHNITWTSTGVNNVMIELDKISSNSGWHLTYSVPASSGLFSWAIPSSMGPASDYRIKIWDSANPSITDSSDSNFSLIVNGYVSCTDSDGGLDYYKKGTAVGRPNIYTNETSSLTDSCRTPDSNNSSNLTEFSCEDNNGVLMAVPRAYTCPNGCENGACKQSTQPTITVISPNGGETWRIGETHNIAWTYTGAQLTNPTWIYLYSYSENGAVSGFWTINSVASNVNSYSWTIPSDFGTITDKTRVKIKISNSSFGDSSDNYFSIVAPTTQPTITVTSPNGGEVINSGSTYRVRWTSVGVDRVTIYVYNDTISGSGSTNYLDFGQTSLSVPASQGYFDWNIVPTWLPAPQPGNENRFRIRIIDPSTQNLPQPVSDTSDNYFTIRGTGSTSCSDTDGGINYYIKGTVSYTNIVGAFQTRPDYCSIDGTVLYEFYCDSANVMRGNTFQCPNGCENGACKQSAQPSITVTSPNGGETWQIGGTYTIKYSANNIPAWDGISIYLQKGYDAGSTKTGVNSSSLIGRTSNLESFSYTVPSTVSSWPGLGSNYTIKVCNTSSCATADTSDNYFSIVAQAVNSVVPQDSLASISAALQAIFQQIQQMYGR